MKKSLVRWGILGAANIATSQMIPAIQATADNQLTGIASRNQNKALQLAKDYQLADSYTDYDSLITSNQVDAVYIPLPTSMHTEWVLKAISAGKHVLCEKPMGMQAQDISRIIEAQKNTELLVGEAYMVAHHSQWACVRNLLETNAIGNLRYIEGSFSYFNRDPNSHKNSPELGGGGLRDIGVYPVICSRLATGQEPLRVKATIDWDPVFKIDRYAKCELEFNEFTLNFYYSTQLADQQSMFFHGEKGWIRVAAPFNPLEWGIARVELWRDPDGGLEMFEWANENQYALQLESFTRSINTKTAFPMSLENSRRNQAIIDALFMADKKGDWEDI